MPVLFIHDTIQFPHSKFIKYSEKRYLRNTVVFCVIIFHSKVRKKARIRNRYNQVLHLSQDTKWERNKITKNITKKSQEVSPFPSGDHKAVKNRRESMTNTGINNTNNQQRKYRLGTVIKIILLEGLNLFHGAPTPLVQMWIKTHRCLVCMKDS